MIPEDIQISALHDASNELSKNYQRSYHLLLRGEYASLLLASVFSVEFSNDPLYYCGYALVFVISLTILITRSLLTPERKWYEARAGAESIKTLAWRFAMRAHPFNAVGSEQQAVTVFTGRILDVVASNPVLMRGDIHGRVSGDQATPSMRQIRTLPLSSRVDFYIDYRIRDQQLWYSVKARQNRRAFKIWLAISVLSYVVAFILALSRIARPSWRFVPLEPVIVFATCAIGWIQIKRHSELASSYTMTATEIGLAREAIVEIENEQTFSDFVNDTELAFSREHTQWVARQRTAG